MKRKVYVFLLSILLASSSIAVAHSGGTDSSGGHYNHSTGDYHYHHGYSEHQHRGGVCEVEEKLEQERQERLQNKERAQRTMLWIGGGFLILAVGLPLGGYLFNRKKE